MVNNTIINYLEISKAGILRTLYPIPLDFLTAYKLKLKVNKELVKKQKLVYYPSQGYKLLVLALTIKTKEKRFTPDLVTLVPLLLPFKEVKSSNAKILRSSFLFKNKIFKTKGEDLEFNKPTSLKNILTISSLQKRKARKVFKKYPKKKLKTGPIESLVFNKANKKKKRQL